MSSESENATRYRALFENPVLGIRIAHTADGRIVEANAAFRQMMGYSDEELLGLTVFDLTHPDDVERKRERFTELAAGTASSSQLEVRLVRKDGSVFWARLTLYPLQDESGPPACNIGLVEDISEHRHVQEALLESTERLHAVLNAAVDGIVLIDPSGLIQMVNPSVEKMFGYPPEELLGRNVKILMPPPWQAEHDGYLSRYRKTGEARIIGTGRQVGGRRRDGSTFPLDLAVSEVRYGTELFFLGTLRDISERVRLENEIRQSQKMEAVGRLAGGVSHDFNTLLGTVLGYSEILLGALPQDQALHRHAEQIHRAAQRGALLTRQLLLFSRRQESKARAVDLGEVFKDVEVMLDRLLGEDIELLRRVEPQLGLVWGDPGELHQVILNLVVNARDAMPDGGTLKVSLSRIAASEEIAVEDGRLLPGSYVVLEVSDTGMGMDEPTRSRIFEPFFTTKEIGKGTGLGLSTVHAIVRRTQGGIAVESQLGEGATFRIYLPSAQEPAGTAEKPAAVAPAPSAERANGERILLVEDDEMLRGLLQLTLEGHGYHVLTAENPAAAQDLAKAEIGAIDLLVSDMVMPGGTGTGLARDLSARYPGMKIVLMSGYTDEALASREDAGRITADAFLEKPFAIRDLLRVVHGLLGT